MNQSEASHTTAPSNAPSGAAMGSVRVLLQMTGYERDVVVGLDIALTVNLAINLALIPAGVWTAPRWGRPLT